MLLLGIESLEILLLLEDLKGLLRLLEHILLFDESLRGHRLLRLLGPEKELLLKLVQE